MSPGRHGRVRQVGGRSRRFRRAGGMSPSLIVASLSVGAALVLAATPTGARAGSLPNPGSSASPVPDILYAAPSIAPQLTNSCICTAPPILTSRATSYRDGQSLYQDLPHD